MTDFYTKTILNITLKNRKFSNTIHSSYRKTTVLQLRNTTILPDAASNNITPPFLRCTGSGNFL